MSYDDDDSPQRQSFSVVVGNTWELDFSLGLGPSLSKAICKIQLISKASSFGFGLVCKNT